MRTVIIGGTGHIGTWLVPRLVRTGHQVIVVTRGARLPYHASEEWTHVERVVMDRAAMEQAGTFGAAIAALRADAIVDLICFTTEQAATLVEAVRGEISHLVHCGTLWVHGVPPHRPYDETAPRAPFGEYGIRKAAIERYLLDEATRGLPVTVLHPGHISGPGWVPINPAGHLDLEVFRRLATGQSLCLPDDGTATLQHVHADDVAQAFACALAQPAAAIGKAFHVAAESPVTLRDYATAAARWFGRDAQLSFLPWDAWRETVSERSAALTEDHVRHSPHASIAKARRVLGYAPRFTAVEAARDAIAALWPDLIPSSDSAAP